MPADVAEDSLELAIELLEAAEPDSESYPFPRLRRLGRSERRTFRTILLENQHFRITVVPDLGGRILRWEDMRSHQDIWDFNERIDLLEAGGRGIELAAGLQIRTRFGDRLNSMGPVANAPDYTEESESPSGLWMGEVCGDGLSLNWRLAAPHDSPFLELEVRAFNRSLEPVPYNGGIAVGGGSWRKSGDLWAWTSEGGTLAVECPYLDYSEDGGLYRFNRHRYLAPHQLDAWTAKIYPSGIGDSLRGASLSAHAGWNGEEMRIQGIEPYSGKAIVLTKSARTLEMPLEVSRDLLLKIPLDSLKDEIEELVVLDADRAERLRAPAASIVSTARADEDPRPACLEPDAEIRQLRDAEFDLGLRHLSHLLSGYGRLSMGDFLGAAGAFEQALIFNGEDHLAWWAKAAAQRKGGAEAEERTELLNAHFLAPLEPVLRAEGFLASPVHSREKSAVLGPLEETPEAFVEVACLLLEANFVQDAARWLTEALLHVDFPVLRYLLAHVYLELGGMEVDAAEQVQLAIRENPEPPYPYRRIEFRALAKLAARFPADGSLRRLLDFAGRFRPLN